MPVLAAWQLYLRRNRWRMTHEHAEFEMRAFDGLQTASHMELYLQVFGRSTGSR